MANENFKTLAESATIVHFLALINGNETPLCRCDKQAEEQNGAKFIYGVFAPSSAFENNKVCATCKAEWLK